MMPRDPSRAHSPYSPYVAIHREMGQRGYCKFEVSFWNDDRPYKIKYWFSTGAADRHLDRKKRRGMRRCKKVLEPAIMLWADSEFKYTMDLNEFILKTLDRK